MAKTGFGVPTLVSMSDAIKARKMIARLNNMSHHFQRAQGTSHRHLSADCKKAIHYILEYNTLLYPPHFGAIGFPKNQTFSEFKEKLGFTPSPKIDDVLDLEKYLKERAANARRAEWIWRIGQAAEELQEEGWYPFFITLTVDPMRHNPRDVFDYKGQGKSPWQQFLHKLTLLVCKQLGHRPYHKTNEPRDRYVKYVAHIEHGQSREHHHLHGIVWLREIPPYWKVCPNRDVGNPTKRVRDRCPAMESLWPYSLPGLSPCKYFRSVNDVWSKLGFCVPYDAKKQRVLRINSPRKAGLYVGKYISKGNNLEWQHRVKATRNLGTIAIRRFCENRRVETLEPLLWRPQTFNQSLGLRAIHSCPTALVRKEAQRMLFFRGYQSKTLTLADVTPEPSVIWLMLVQKEQSGQSIRRMPSPQLFDLIVQHLPEQKGFCEKRFFRAHKKLANVSPPAIFEGDHQSLGIRL